MAQHKCGTECPAQGPKVTCVKCKKKCNLVCFGYEKCNVIEGNETVMKKFPDGTVSVTFLSCMIFSCCSNDISSSEVRATLKFPLKRDTSKRRSSNANENTISNEIKSMKDLLQSIKDATDANTAEIAEIKSMSTKNEANVKKITEQKEQTPNIGAAMNYAAAYRSSALSRAANQTPTSASKRERTNSPISRKMELPAPKIGTKPSVNGLLVVPKLNRNKDDKPKFEKALFVSRLDPTTTCEQMVNYIKVHTPVKDENRFHVHRMVKKDADVTALRFVSFKIELNVDDLDVLDDESLWPDGSIVREFKPAPKNELGKYFPPLNHNSNPASSNLNERNVPMDV